MFSGLLNCPLSTLSLVIGFFGLFSHAFLKKSVLIQFEQSAVATLCRGFGGNINLQGNIDDIFILGLTVPLRRERGTGVRGTKEGRLEKKKREAGQEGCREGWRAVTCGVGMEQCSPQGLVVSPAPHFSPHSPTHPTPLTSSPFSPPPLFWIQLQRVGYMGEVGRCTVKWIKWQKRQTRMDEWIKGEAGERNYNDWVCVCILVSRNIKIYSLSCHESTKQQKFVHKNNKKTKFYHRT